MRTLFGNFILALTITASQDKPQVTTNPTPAEIYSQLEIALGHTRKSGFSVSDNKELRDLRQRIVDQGDAGALFALEKLGTFNHTEANAARSGACEDVLSSDAVLQNAPIKAELFLILAESYPHLSFKVQPKVLQGLIDSYTPAIGCDPTGGRALLGWSLIRIGRPSVDPMSKLAASPYESVRCGVDDLLNEIAKPSASLGGSVGRAPKLICADPIEQRTGQLHRWSAWWRKYGSRVTFPTLPDWDLDDKQ